MDASSDTWWSVVQDAAGRRASDTSPAAVFVRAWARALLRQAARRQRARARGDERAERRVDLLRLRFRGELRLRDIAARWRVDPAWLRREYAAARQEFEMALWQVVAGHRRDASPGGIAAACRRVIRLATRSRRAKRPPAGEGS